MQERGVGVAEYQQANEYSCAHGAQINFGDLTPFNLYTPQWLKELLMCSGICTLHNTMHMCSRTL